MDPIGGYHIRTYRKNTWIRLLCRECLAKLSRELEIIIANNGVCDALWGGLLESMVQPTEITQIARRSNVCRKGILCREALADCSIFGACGIVDYHAFDRNQPASALLQFKGFEKCRSTISVVEANTHEFDNHYRSPSKTVALKDRAGNKRASKN